MAVAMLAKGNTGKSEKQTVDIEYTTLREIQRWIFQFYFISIECCIYIHTFLLINITF